MSADAEALATLREQRRAWDERPLLRRVYGGFFHQIASRMSAVDGPAFELGSGCGAMREFLPAVVPTDVIDTPWAERIADAQALPFADGEVANLVMVDVFHHLQDPGAALAEAARTLAPGGRLVMHEPYCSPLSTLGYRAFHHEPLDLRADLESAQPQSSTDPLDANIAIPTIAFWRRRTLISARAPELRVAELRRMSWLLYPLCGGFTGRRLVPNWAAGPLGAIDRGFDLMFGPVGGYRCMVVLERRDP